MCVLLWSWGRCDTIHGRFIPLYVMNVFIRVLCNAPLYFVIPSHARGGGRCLYIHNGGGWLGWPGILIFPPALGYHHILSYGTSVSLTNSCQLILLKQFNFLPLAVS